MHLNPFLTPGSILIFDEFIPEDEFAALHTFCRACIRSWRIVAARRDLVKVALEITR